MASTDPTGYLSIPPDLIRGMAWKQPCRVATSANITISTALNAGDTIDGVTLAAGDRVLVKDQTTGSQNGIYVVSASPLRAFDMDQDLSTAVPADEILGAAVQVIAGTVNGGTFWRVTNTSAATLGTTAIAWAQFASGAALTVKDEGSALATPATSIDFVGSGVTATGAGAAKTVTIPGTSPADAGAWVPVMDGLGNVVTDSGTGAAIMTFVTF